MAGIILNPSSGSHSVTIINCGSSSPYAGGLVDLAQFASLQQFDGGDNNLSAVTGIAGLQMLTDFTIQGANTVAFSVQDLPPSLQNLDIRGNNTVSGNLSDMPSGMLSINIAGANTIQGNIQDMNCPSCTYLSIDGNQHAIGGNTNGLPNSLVFFNLSAGANNQSIGNIGNLPATLITYSNASKGTVTGDVATLPANLEFFLVEGRNTTTGNIGSLPSSVKYFSNTGRNTTTGNLKDLPAGITFYNNRGRNTATGYYDGTITGYGQRSWAPNMSYFTVLPFSLGMTQEELVTLLVDLSLTTWASEKVIRLDGPTNPTINLTTYPSAATAIANLQSQGVDVFVNTTA